MNSSNKSVLLAWLAGALIGAVVAIFAYPFSYAFRDVQLRSIRPAEAPPRDPAEPWTPNAYTEFNAWRRVSFGDGGFTVEPTGTYEDLSEALDLLGKSEREIVIPVLPSVYVTHDIDKLYYDAILASDIGPEDKVLVIGPGSGADSWAVSLKTDVPVHAIDINPMAVVNTKLTARLGGFEVRAIVGDFRDADLPDDFRDFDYVLWNMPFVEVDATPDNFEQRDFHDGDDGDVLRAFLARLPSLLKEDGVAIALNYALAREHIDLPGVETRVAEGDEEITNTTYMLFTIPNPGTAE